MPLIRSFTTRSNQAVKPGKFTILVGPNNSGKSQTLRDIQTRMVASDQPRQPGFAGYTVVLDDIDFELPQSFADLFAGIQKAADPTTPGRTLLRGVDHNLRGGQHIAVQLEQLENLYKAGSVTGVLQQIGQFRVALVDASSRLVVTEEVASHNPHTTSPANLLQGLFSRPDKEASLREVFRRIFGMDIKLDISGMQVLTLRVAREFDPIPDDPRQAYPVMERYRKLSQQGDGFKSLAGVVISLLLSEGRVVLLDEPDAFLHPAQARGLGEWIARQAQQQAGQVFVATHNASFLAGVLSADLPVDIYRLNRTGDTTQFHRVPAEVTRQLALSPLLSSQRVLEAIFYRGVVVCEADADRSVYQMVAVREFHNQDFLFVHAHNKQVIKDVVAVLRQAAIPCCVITDVDLLDSETDLKALVQALAPDVDIAPILEGRKAIAIQVLGRDEEEILKRLIQEVDQFLGQLREGKHVLSGARGALNRLRRAAADWSTLKAGGVEAYTGSLKDDLESLLADLRKHGLFLVPVGELEGWLDLGVRQKSKWIVPALQAISEGRSPQSLKDFVGATIKYLEKRATE